MTNAIRKSEIDFVLVSSCLMGFKTRYDGKSSEISKLPLLLNEIPIPICPEQLGGLPTPREASELASNSIKCIFSGEEVLSGKLKVLGCETKSDFSSYFIRGAEETLKICKYYNCKRAVLKNRSPSCGCGAVYFKGELIEGNGVTAALLLKHDIQVIVI